MSKAVEEDIPGDRILHQLSHKPDFSAPPIRAVWRGAVDYTALGAYLRAHGERVVDLVLDHLADDELRPLARALWEYIGENGEM
jgi:hypothetical protein